MPAPDPQSPDELRNVVLVGPGGAGKSTLFDALVAGRVPGRRQREGRARSVALSAAALGSNGLTINLLDTPGYPDFIGELRAGLRAADAAIFVIAAAEETGGIDGATALLWQELAGLDVPRAIAVSKLDLPRADYDDTVATCRRVFGDAQPLYLPLTNSDGQLVGSIGLLSRRVFDHSSGQRIERDPTDEEATAIAAYRGDLIEAIITESEDDTLLDRYLEGEEISTDTVVDDLLKAVETAAFFPLVPVNAADGVGTEEIFEIVERCFPSPAASAAPAAYRTSGVALDPLACDPNGPLVAEVIRTTSDPYVGRLSLVRVFSGTLRSDETCHVSGHLGDFLGVDAGAAGHADHDDDERVGPLASPLDEQTRPKPRAIAGDLALVSGLSRAETSDTLSGSERPILVEPWVLPEPLLPVAIRAANKRDEDKLAGALQRIVAEDVTLRMEHNAETHQVVLWTMGQAHVDEVLGRLADRHGVAVEAEPLRIALRETFIRAVTVQGRHVKQSGGHGQYAVCQLQIEPLERGAGIEFVDKVVGGAVPRQYIPSVEKGARGQLASGVLAGYPVVDVRVTLLDGKAHSVDSSDMAFQTAAALALREAANASTVSLLEPIDSVDIVMDDEHLGAVLSDLRGRRGHVIGTEPVLTGAAGDGAAGSRTVVHAQVPALELSRYAVDLRSVSRGTGTFTRELLHYDYLPAELTKAQLDGG
jgi:elongation factor G